MAKKLTVSRDACETVGLSASVHHNVLAQRFLVWLVLLVFFGMIAVLLRYSSTKQSVGSSSLVHSSGLTLSQQPAISCPARRVHCRAVVGRRRSLSPRQELDYESCSGRKSNETLTATNLHPLQIACDRARVKFRNRSATLVPCVGSDCSLVRIQHVILRHHFPCFGVALNQELGGRWAL